MLLSPSSFCSKIYWRAAHPHFFNTLLAPGGKIQEHFHPFFDETFFVHSGALKVMLNDKEYPVKAGDLVYMPAGTIISGINDKDERSTARSR